MLSKSLGLKIGVGVVASALAYLGSTYAIGHSVESRMKQGLADISSKSPFVSVVKNDYQRGFRTSKQTLVLALGCGSDKTQVTLHQTITHGPLFVDGSVFGRASIVTDIEVPKDAQAKVKEIFKGEKPLNIVTVIGLAGGVTTHIDSPAVKYTETNADNGNKIAVDWQGLTAEVGMSSLDSEISELSMVAPKLSLSSSIDSSSMTIADMRLTGDTIAAMKDLGMSDAEMTVKSVQFAMPKTGTVSIDNIQYDAKSTVNNDFLDVSAKFSVAKMSAQGKVYGPANYDVLVKHLHMPALLRLKAALEVLQRQQCNSNVAQTGELDPKVMAALRTEGAALLAKTPEVDLQRLSLKLPEGEVKLQAKASLPNFVASDLDNPQALTTKLVANADLVAPEVIVRALLVKSAPQMAGMLDVLVQQGVIVRQGQALQVKAEWKKGAPSINGKSTQEIMGVLMGGQAATASPE